VVVLKNVSDSERGIGKDQRRNARRYILGERMSRYKHLDVWSGGDKMVLGQARGYGVCP
jgi:hypothetical protein